MVKNTHGGNKHKKFARKRDNTGRNDIVSLKKTEEQEYGYITKILGNCRFNILCYDKKERIGHVRGKLRKRTFFEQGDFILVSLRDFQDNLCDMIQKYTYDQVNILINNNEVKECFAKNGQFFDNNTKDTVDVSFNNSISDTSDDETETTETNLKINTDNHNNKINVDDLTDLDNLF
uniref:S1-like domain-containing protein n=1 Tax=viral metagenome TaxID=1070528 RepID=A0A6C0IYB3_9ZZZZ